MKKLLLLLVVLAVAVSLLWNRSPNTPPVSAARNVVPINVASGTYGARTWANSGSLPDHFARHGHEFGAKNPEDYARMAYEFFQRAQAEGWMVKVDSGGVYRLFDSRSGAFGAYNADGTTKTFFKPGSRGYFDRQPGRLINLKTKR